MRIDRLMVAGAVGLSLSGCASLLGPAGAPGCDGYARRPLNRSMWAWDRAKPVAKAEVSPALPAPEPSGPPEKSAELLTRSLDPAERRRSTSSTAPVPRYDVAASRRACTLKETGHG